MYNVLQTAAQRPANTYVMLLFDMNLNQSLLPNEYTQKHFNEECFT